MTNYTGLPIEVFVPNQENREGSYFDIIVSYIIKCKFMVIMIV